VGLPFVLVTVIKELQMSASALARVQAIIAMVVTFLIAAGCGGGISVASVGSGGTGYPAGTGSGVISGFGSLIVDGMRRNDSTATYMSEQGQGLAIAMPVTGATVGQSVEYSYDNSGNMMSALVSPELVGSVAAVGPNSLTVLGTSVLINNDPSLGPVTRLAGYASLAAVKVGDRVEVHGLLKIDNQGVVSVQATLIAQTPLATGVRLTGYVTQYNATAGTFAIGSNLVKVGTATIAPGGTALANGELVTIWSSADPAGNTITANTIRVKWVSSTGQNATVSGAIANLTSGAIFQIGSLIVDASKAVIAPSGTALGAGQYVVVVGTIDAGSNKLMATDVTVFTAATPTEVELHGTVANFVSSSSLTVRGVVVDASAATFTGGTVSQLANGVFVEVHGTVTNNVVHASSVVIQALTPLQAPGGSTVDVSGTITSYSAMTGSYTMTMASGATISGTLGSSMFYMNGTVANLMLGQSASATGMLNGGVLLTSVMNFSQATVAPGPNSIHMEGIAYNVTPTSLMLNGILIQINGVPVQGVGMMGGRSMMSGMRVAVDVQLTNGQYMATAITLQNG
jgi:hypothetical protein